MTVYLVGAGPGDPGLLTRRGARLLSQADVVIYDRLVHHSILTLAPEAARLIDVGKEPGAPSSHQRQEEINRLLVRHGAEAHTVVRLKGGDPFLFGRGGEEVEALTKAGIPFEVVPGVSSAFAVPAAAGIPVTHRALASSVTVVTGRVGADSERPGVDWEALARSEGTLVILMGMSTRAEIADALLKAGKPADTPVAVIENGTTPAQRAERTTLDKLAAVSLGSPAIIVVGPVAALGAEGSPVVDGPLRGRSVVVTRSSPRAKGLVEALERVGARVVEMPLTTQTGPSDEGAALRVAAERIAEYDWVVFTSANAVEPFLGELRDVRQLGAVKVVAVGPASADALRMTGVEPDLIPAEHWAHGVVEVFPEHVGSGRGRVLFPSADLAPDTIPTGLQAKGWDVDRVEAYRTVNLPFVEATVLAQAVAADAVTFTASSSIRAYLALRGPDGSSLSVPPVVVCIGPTTAGTARELGLTGVFEAWGATTQGIVDALIHHLTAEGGDSAS